MGWARLDDGFHDHPKLIGLSLEALGLWTKCLTWAHRHHGATVVLGRIPDGLPTTFAGTRARRLTAELVEHRLWDVEDGIGGWQIHDYVDFLPASEKPESASEVSKARSEAGKKGAEKRWGAQATSEQADSKLPSSGQEHSMPPTRPDPSDTHVSQSTHVPDRASSTDDESTRERRNVYWAGFGITNPGRVVALLIGATSRPITEDQAIAVVAGIRAKAKQLPKSPQRYIEAAIQQSWAEIQQEFDEAALEAIEAARAPRVEAGIEPPALEGLES